MQTQQLRAISAHSVLSLLFVSLYVTCIECHAVHVTAIYDATTPAQSVNRTASAPAAAAIAPAPGPAYAPAHAPAYAPAPAPATAAPAPAPDGVVESLLSEKLVDPARMALLQTACLSGPCLMWLQHCRLRPQDADISMQGNAWCNPWGVMCSIRGLSVHTSERVRLSVPCCDHSAPLLASYAPENLHMFEGM